MLKSGDINYDKYKDYSVEDLVQDDFFISSAIKPTKESDVFWQDMIETGIILLDDYQQACYLVDSLQVRSESIAPCEIEQLWDCINLKNNQHKDLKKKKWRQRFLWTMSGVASVLLFLVYISYIKEQKEVYTSIEAVEAPANPVSDIQLILADNETMALEGKEAEIEYDSEGIAINKDTKLKKPVNAKESVEFNQLIVPKGKRSTLTFEDGTKIWVNANTRVVYPVVFASSKREIYVDGEVFLDVSADKKRPFIIKSKVFNVEVLGTTFDLMAYEDDDIQHLVLVSGSVRIKSPNKKEVILSPNEMFLVNHGISSVQAVDVNDYITWKTGMYKYESEKLGIIMQRLSRYYGEEINCEPEVVHLRCSGKLDLKDDIDNVLKGISQTAPVDYKMIEGKYVIVNK